MFTVGCTSGPVLHYWHIWLEKVFVGKALNTVGKKVLVDQAVASPVFGLWFFVGELAVSSVNTHKHTLSFVLMLAHTASLETHTQTHMCTKVALKDVSDVREDGARQ